MLAVRPSFRGARLHTFQPEDTRVYTSTPTKIGGHCLDHVRNGLTLNLSGAASQGAAQASGKRAREPAAASTFDPKGRFGGLCGVVLKLYPPAPSPPGGVFRKLEQQLQHQQRILCASLEHYPLYLAPTTLPPDTLTVAVEAGGQRYGPEWPSERTVSEARRNGSSGEVIEGRFHNMNRHARHMAASATGHSGALMAILLAKLANGGDEAAAGSPGAFPRADMEVSTDVDVATAVVAGAVGEIPVDSTKDVVQEGSTCTSILVAKSPVSMTRGNNTSVSGSSETWAWKARVDQTPRHSKLRRYSFVRKLGRGSHGTILLVRKTCGSTTCTRVLKESEYLPEAVNEARLLLLAGGSGVGGRVAPQGRADVISVHYNPRKVSAESPVVPKRRSSLGVEGAAIRELAAADAVSVRSGESHQRGDVIQVKINSHLRWCFRTDCFLDNVGNVVFLMSPSDFPGSLSVIQSVSNVHRSSKLRYTARSNDRKQRSARVANGAAGFGSELQTHTSKTLYRQFLTRTFNCASLPPPPRTSPDFVPPALRSNPLTRTNRLRADVGTYSYTISSWRQSANVHWPSWNWSTVREVISTRLSLA